MGVGAEVAIGARVVSGVGVGLAVRTGMAVLVGVAVEVGRGVGAGLPVDAGGTGVNVDVGGTVVGIAVGGTSVGGDGTSVAFVVAVAVARALVGLGLGVGGFVGSGLGDSRVGEGSTSTLATTLVSGDGVSAVLPSPPRDASSNINTTRRRNDNANLRLLSLYTSSCTQSHTRLIAVRRRLRSRLSTSSMKPVCHKRSKAYALAILMNTPR